MFIQMSLMDRGREYLKKGHDIDWTSMLYYYATDWNWCPMDHTDLSSDSHSQTKSRSQVVCLSAHKKLSNAADKEKFNWISNWILYTCSSRRDLDKIRLKLRNREPS